MESNFDFDDVLRYAESVYFSYLRNLKIVATKDSLSNAQVFSVYMIQNSVLKDMLEYCGIDTKTQYDIWYNKFENQNK